MSDFSPGSPAKPAGMGYAQLCTMSKRTAKDVIGSALVIVLTVSVILALLLAGT
jgi:Tfp pilus assembly protein PilX